MHECEKQFVEVFTRRRVCNVAMKRLSSLCLVQIQELPLYKLG